MLIEYTHWFRILEIIMDTNCVHDIMKSVYLLEFSLCGAMREVEVVEFWPGVRLLEVPPNIPPTTFCTASPTPRGEGVCRTPNSLTFVPFHTPKMFDPRT